MSAKLRCAIYTRKSTEEGLDQAFNSLHAQREACEAFVRSQAGEGWTFLREAYDDGGFSGGSMERPALARLLADIAARRIDIVVVYKVDRLTRSLADFAKIVEAFDARGVSFVSVTQAFNTTTSMGRLTLNVLLSFAQFEREVTGERIRDKIAASKAKGMWMGGNLPLGYEAPIDPATRALVVNPAEAATVQLIFARYLELGSVHELKRWLDAEGIKPKRGKGLFSRGALFHLLKNRTYLGEIPHRDTSYPGAHAPILEGEVFDAVQRQLTAQTQRSGAGTGTRPSSALTGKLFDAKGDPMSPTSTRGGRGQTYRYYVSTSLLTGRGRTDDGVLRRVPAAAIERLVREMIGVSPTPSPSAIDRVEVHSHSLHVVVDAKRLFDRVVEAIEAAAEVRQRLSADTRVLVETEEPVRLRLIRAMRLGLRGGKRVILDAVGRRADIQQRADPVLIRALRTSHELAASLGECAVGRLEQARLSAAPPGPYERNLIKLAFLAPDLQRAILEGRQPTGLTLQALIESDLPPAWVDQRSWAEELG